MGPRLPAALCVITLLTASSACEETPTPEGPAARAAGAVEGAVRLEGQVPAPGRFPTNEVVSRACGETVQDPSLRVGPTGAVQGAVVFWADAPAAQGQAPKEVVVDQEGCLFVPAVVAAEAGATVILKNSDPLTHNVRALRPQGDLFNVAMPLEGMTLKKTLPKEPGVIRLHCDIHPWMDALVRSFPHPHFASTDASGRFRLPDLPAGKRTLEVWHPRLPPRRIQVEVTPGGVGRVEVAIPADQLRPLPALR